MKPGATNRDQRGPRWFGRLNNNGDCELADRAVAAASVNHGGLVPDQVAGPEVIPVSVALDRAAGTAFRGVHGGQDAVVLRFTAEDAVALAVD